MERIEHEKHDIEREKIEAAETHDQLLCNTEKAK